MELDFESILTRLVQSQVSFLVVGGVACALNGFVRATEDLDILIDPATPNIKSLINVLEKWGEGYAGELKEQDFPVSPGAVRLVEL